MDFSAWSVDLPKCCATHSSGFRIEIEGSPRDPSAVHPGKFPSGLSSIEQVRLLRIGLEAIAEAAKKGGRKAAPSRPAYTPPANRPQRPTLSLKKKPGA